MVMVSQLEAPPMDIVQLLDTPKDEDSSKHEVPLTCSLLAIISIVHKPSILEHLVTDSFEVEDPTREDSPTYSSSKDLSLAHFPLLSDRDKRLEDLALKTSSKAGKKKQRHHKIKWSKEKEDVVKKGVKRFGLGHWANIL